MNIIRVRVKTKSAKERLEIGKQGILMIRVKEPAEHNLANRRVIGLVAEHFGVTIRKVRILRGYRHSNKVLSVASEET